MAFQAAVIGSLRSTAYRVIAQVRASTTALTALRMYDEPFCTADSGKRLVWT
jgi:hypothetical protein